MYIYIYIYIYNSAYRSMYTDILQLKDELKFVVLF